MDRCIGLNKIELDQLDAANKKLVQELSDSEKAIKDRGEMMKRVIDSRVQSTVK